MGTVRRNSCRCSIIRDTYTSSPAFLVPEAMTMKAGAETAPAFIFYGTAVPAEMRRASGGDFLDRLTYWAGRHPLSPTYNLVTGLPPRHGLGVAARIRLSPAMEISLPAAAPGLIT